MHLNADDVDVAHFRGALIHRRKLAKRDTELVLARAGRDIFVRVRIDVGIGAQCNGCPQIFRASNLVDVLQLRFTLDVETVNALIERVFDLLARFAHACECAFGRIAAGRQHAKKLTCRHNVEACARIGEQLQNRAIRIRFGCVTDQVLKRSEGRIQAAVVIENCPRAVNIKRRAKFLSNARKIDIFAIEFAAAIAKRMHSEM